MAKNPGLARKILYVMKENGYEEKTILTSRKMFLDIQYAAHKNIIDLSELAEYKTSKIGRAHV